MRLLGAEGYGAATGEPLVEADLRFGGVRPEATKLLWHVSGEVGPHTFDQRLTAHDGGVLTLHTTDGALEVDRTAHRISCDAPTESLRRQLVATFGVPLLVQDGPVLILHACAAVPPSGDGAVAVCAASGGGKSTLLAALMTRGWRAVSEDICVVDLRGDDPLLWPGPPWVRTTAEIRGAASRFTAGDKTAWDIAPHQVDRAYPLRTIVFMEPPGADEAARTALAPSEAIARAAAYVMWLGDPAERAARTFGSTVRVMSSVPSGTMRLPRSDDWTDRAEALLR